MSDRSDIKHRTFLQVARTVGQLGTCDRAQVGAVIVRDGRCVSWGFNGAPPGMPHCEENNHGWSGWEAVPSEGCRNVTHAEANALAFSAKQGVSTDHCTLYVTLSPCIVCARLLIAAGIVHVVYAEAYRDTEGIELLRSALVRVDEINHG